MILLDNQATISVFRSKSYLEDVRKVRNACDIFDIGGKLKAKQMGNNDIVGEAGYDANTFANAWA